MSTIWRSGKIFLKLCNEDVPLIGAVEIVAHEETAAIEELAELGDLVIGQLPVAHFHRVEPGVIENIVVLSPD